MALLRTRLFAGALFVGALFGASDAPEPVVFRGKAGSVGIYNIFNSVQAPVEDPAIRLQNNVLLAVAAAVIGSGVLD
jgi:hypothetical protein